MLNEVEGSPLSDGVHEDHSISPGEGVNTGEVIIVTWTQITDLKEDRVTIHHHLILVPGLRLMVILTDVSLGQEPHNQSCKDNFMIYILCVSSIIYYTGSPKNDDN